MRRRRAAMYVAVLTTTMLVLVLGLSGLTAARIRFGTQQRVSDAVSAGYLAQGSLEHALQSLQDNSNWRSTYTHDTWTSSQGLGDGSMQWKLFDDVNGDLSDPCSPLLLIGRGAQGDAVRMLQVQIQTERGPEALKNGDFESEPGDEWDDSFFSSCTLKQQGNPVSGSFSCGVRNRMSNYAGPAQNVTNDIQSGETYELRAWVSGFAGMSVTIGLYIETYSNSFLLSDSDMLSSSNWELVSVELTPTFSDELIDAHLVLFVDNTSGDFDLDDLSVRPALEVKLEHGSFKRVLD